MAGFFLLSAAGLLRLLCADSFALALVLGTMRVGFGFGEVCTTDVAGGAESAATVNSAGARLASIPAAAPRWSAFIAIGPSTSNEPVMAMSKPVTHASSARLRRGPDSGGGFAPTQASRA